LIGIAGGLSKYYDIEKCVVSPFKDEKRASLNFRKENVEGHGCNYEKLCEEIFYSALFGQRSCRGGKNALVPFPSIDLVGNVPFLRRKRNYAKVYDLCNKTSLENKQLNEVNQFCNSNKHSTSETDTTKGILLNKNSGLKVTLSPPFFEMESFYLFKKYEATIHKRKKSKLSDYLNVMIPTVLENTQTQPLNDCERQLNDLKLDFDQTEELFTEKKSLTKIPFGSYHLKVVVNEVLVAVSSIVISPDCIHSRYCVYEPSYTRFSLGTYTIMQEIRLAEILRIKHYYLCDFTPKIGKYKYKVKRFIRYILLA
jgi:arginyl-tRNA--protein-N-Asp/Glu arginylyltransferase